MFTQVRSTIRRVTPAEVNGRRLLKVVYVVLEPQYQSALTHQRGHHLESGAWPVGCGAAT